MAGDEKRSDAHREFGEIAPDFARLTEDVLFGEIWERPGLSKRDRSLITCAALVACGRTEQMASHFRRAVRNGLSREELVEMTTHLAFYSGWPSAVSAIARIKETLGEK